ncbi:hypothetical protein C2G38_2202169 [Gigaspora rosea]|uniref:DUF7869 domain-containing protein n=1 Tax=Gigaspora rosea TaxID=44941 RepID=A0A397UP44_9GLOM|nr:hypothetical protein C2G38_2202169 [Gigaspora rosea]
MRFNAQFWAESEQIKMFNNGMIILIGHVKNGSIIISIFGICEEAFPQQTNYLIKENEYVGKGANIVISIIQHYFENHGFGEKFVVIHADNCPEQNKNNIMIKYLIWHVLNNLYKQIIYSFMVAGHTKFSPDGFFGLIKLKLRNSEVDSLTDMVQVVQNSTIGAIT